MEQQIISTEQKLAQSVMRFNKIFMQFHRTDLHQNFAGCKPGAVGVLFAIRERNKSGAREMKVSEISKLMHVTSPTITQFVKDLEANGLVERHIDPTDRRAVGIALTERGEKIAIRVESLFSATFHGLTKYLGDEQSNQLVELLEKANRYFSEREVDIYQSHWNGDEEV
jgi:DNA-binding MarR family transcriptional regulator